jgi:ABC-type phosphate transport system substrate-binding protein
MRRFVCLVILIGFLLACSALVLQAQAISSGDIAIVVNSEVPIDNLSFDDVRKLVLGDKQYWAGHLRVTLLMRAPVARERDVVLRKVCDMNEAQFRQYWIGKVFRAETASGPKIVYSNDMARSMLSSLPGSIAFIDSTEVPRNLKVLQIDGKLPGQQGYPLR